MPLTRNEVEERRKRKQEIYKKISMFLADHTEGKKYYCAKEIADELQMPEKKITEQLNKLFKNLSDFQSTVYLPNRECELTIDREEKDGIPFYAFVKI